VLSVIKSIYTHPACGFASTIIHQPLKDKRGQQKRGLPILWARSGRWRTTNKGGEFNLFSNQDPDFAGTAAVISSVFGTRYSATSRDGTAQLNFLGAFTPGERAGREGGY